MREKGTIKKKGMGMARQHFQMAIPMKGIIKMVNDMVKEHTGSKMVQGILGNIVTEKSMDKVGNLHMLYQKNVPFTIRSSKDCINGKFTFRPWPNDQTLLVKTCG